MWRATTCQVSIIYREYIISLIRFQDCTCLVGKSPTCMKHIYIYGIYTRTSKILDLVGPANRRHVVSIDTPVDQGTEATNPYVLPPPPFSGMVNNTFRLVSKVQIGCHRSI